MSLDKYLWFEAGTRLTPKRKTTGFKQTDSVGGGVSMAHQLVELWPDDTVGIITVASGGTGKRGFEKDWVFERTSPPFDEKRLLYRNLMNPVVEAGRFHSQSFEALSESREPLMEHDKISPTGITGPSSNQLQNCAGISACRSCPFLF